MSPTLQTPELHYPFATAPEAGHYERIADGLYWLRMPLPITSLNHINLWLLESEHGFNIVDTGWATEENIGVWEYVEQNLFQQRPIERVVATHMHPDHIGLAGWLTETYQSDLYMSRDEYLNCHLLLRYSHEEAPAAAVNFYRAAGYDEQQLQKYRAHFGQFGQFVRYLPHAYHRLVDGDHLHMGGYDWEVIVGSGHSPEHVCLYDAERDIFIAGDQLLPKISSNVSVWPTEPHANPLAEWLASCHKLAERLTEKTLVLPAHGKPFYGAPARLQYLITEIEENLQKLAEFCQTPQRPVDTFPVLFHGPVSSSNLMMAAGESLAHLHCLQARGIVDVEYKEGVGYWQGCV